MSSAFVEWCGRYPTLSACRRTAVRRRTRLGSAASQQHQRYPSQRDRPAADVQHRNSQPAKPAGHRSLGINTAVARYWHAAVTQNVAAFASSLAGRSFAHGRGQIRMTFQAHRRVIRRSPRRSGSGGRAVSAGTRRSSERRRSSPCLRRASDERLPASLVSCREGATEVAPNACGGQAGQPSSASGPDHTRPRPLGAPVQARSRRWCRACSGAFGPADGDDAKGTQRRVRRLSG
jgi:hypothetical protein